MNEMTTISRGQRAYSAAASKFLARKSQLFINNELVDSSHGATIDVEDLSSGKIIAQVVAASVIDLSGWSPRYFKPQIMPGIMKDNAARVLGLA